MITIATNMAGRGTDIVLGGNLEKMVATLEADETLDETTRAQRIQSLRDNWQADHEKIKALGGLRIIADQALDLSEARARFARYLRLATPAAQLDAPRLKALLEPFRPAKGCPVRLDDPNAAARCQLELDDSGRARPDDALLASLRGWQGEHSVSIVF